mmetsp:Transcript_15341/g.30585  ORF Transcript_15341/g.30585 Transcript_15341/m.30585 type:complete len:83 (+) Transcript_15341:21-269(+)
MADHHNDKLTLQSKVVTVSCLERWYIDVSMKKDRLCQVMTISVASHALRRRASEKDASPLPIILPDVGDILFYPGDNSYVSS